VARSLGEVGSLQGMELRFAGPEGFEVPEEELERFRSLGAVGAWRCATALDAAQGAHAVHTDTWVSMGQEAEKAARIELFAPFTVSGRVMAAADPEAIFMHCLPAYRGLEVTPEVIDGPRSVVIRQGHHRLDAARAVLAFCCGVDAQRPGGATR